MKKALLIVGHGSKLKDGLETFDKIVELVREISDCHTVEGAYMEFAKPSMEEQIEYLASLHTEEITVVPYFLFEGIHVKRDIPEIIKKMSEKYNNIKFKLAKSIGAEAAVADILLKRADDAEKI